MPWTWCQGSSGGSSGASPASMSWRWVATEPVSTLMKNQALRAHRDSHDTRDLGAGACRLRPLARARGMAERTRRAYGADLGDFAAWADRGRRRAGRGRATGCCAATPRTCPRRRGEGGRALSPPTVARKLAAIRTFFRYMVEREEIAPEPGRPGRLAAQAAQAAQAAARRRGGARCSTASRPARRSSCATARCSSSPTPAGCAARRS